MPPERVTQHDLGGQGEVDRVTEGEVRGVVPRRRVLDPRRVEGRHVVGRERRHAQQRSPEQHKHACCEQDEDDHALEPKLSSDHGGKVVVVY